MLQLSPRLAVAPDGRVLVPGTPSFEQHVGYRRPDFDLAEYAARNMGYVTLSWTGEDSAEMHFRPSLLTPSAVEVICRLLLRQRVIRLELRYLGEDADPARAPNLPVLLHRLLLLSSAAQGLVITHRPY